MQICIAGAGSATAADLGSIERAFSQVKVQTGRDDDQEIRSFYDGVDLGHVNSDHLHRGALTRYGFTVADLPMDRPDENQVQLRAGVSRRLSSPAAGLELIVNWR